MIKKRIIPTNTLGPKSKEMIQKAIVDEYGENGEIPNKRFKVSVNLTAQEMRYAYTLGMIDPSTAEQYDLFKCKNTRIVYDMFGSTIEKAVIEDTY